MPQLPFRNLTSSGTGAVPTGKSCADSLSPVNTFLYYSEETSISICRKCLPMTLSFAHVLLIEPWNSILGAYKLHSLERVEQAGIYLPFKQ